MQIHQRIKAIREAKKLSQEFIAVKLDLSQSQYSRRETGDIPFVPNEIIKIASLLETTIAHLFGEEYHIDKDKNSKTQYNFISSKLIEQYELRIKEKEDIIDQLKNIKKKSKT